MSNKDFGKLIKDLRQKNNMTQKELGEKLHITDKAISKWERGISLPDLEMLNTIAEVFQIPLSDLLNNEITNNNTSSNETITKSKIEVFQNKLIIFGFLLLVIIAIFIINDNNKDSAYINLDEVIVGTQIANPDRIIYKDYFNNYYEFLSGTEKYSNLKALLQKSITDYTNSGVYLTQDDIDEIHKNTSFIEFDYNTISKNYIIRLDENNNQSVIRLATTGGNVCTNKISNLDKVNFALSILIQDEKAYKLEYNEFISNNYLETLEDTSLLKKIDTNIYQVKIENLEEYEYFKNLYNINIDKNINDETFENNDIILTFSIDYNISFKVNIGNIQYTYNAINSENPTFTTHILIVSKIVNTNCIYNDISNYSNFNYDKTKLNSEIFMQNFDEFLIKYNSATSLITQDEAIEIAENGYKIANVSMIYDSAIQTITEETVYPNNYFYKNSTDSDETFSESVEAYTICYEDELGNGIIIYVDKKLGMIIGAKAFGD